ncbi:glycosyl hydrolase family 28, partial [Paenibacillus prosopidis]
MDKSIGKHNKRSRIQTFLLAILVAFIPMMANFPTKAEAATTLVTYPAPATGVTMNTTYTVQVRVPGGAWQNVDVYNTTVGIVPANASIAYFDTDGPVELSVTYNSGTVTSAAVHPTSKGITPAVNGNTMTFSISGPTKLSLEVNDNINNNLHLFVNPLEVNPPSPTDPNVIYLGPGVHNQSYVVPSGKTLYLAGGGVINGNVMFQSANNAKFLGRGMLSRPNYGGLVINFSNNITVDGIIVNNYGNANGGGTGANIGNSTNVLLNNVKWIAHKKWTDGINVYGSSNVTINDAFFRTGDDAIAIYSTRQGGGESYWGNVSNIKVSNTILMPDVAHPIQIGVHGDPSAPGGGVVIDNVTFDNIDILTHNALSCSRASNIVINSGDGNLVSNIMFNNIRIKDVCAQRIFETAVVYSTRWMTGPGRGIKNVYFKDVSYTGTNANSNNISGYDASRLNQDYTFENLRINGNLIMDAASGNISVGNHAKNVNFIASGGTPPKVTPFPSVTPINLALNKSASSDSSQSGNPASSGNDSSTSTRWSANDANTGHSWTVDLGSSMRITDGTQVKWEQSGKVYKYKIETSNDNSNWTMKVDKTANTSTVQTQTDNFKADARYVKITVTGLESGVWASFYDFKVLGEQWNLAMGKTASSDSTMSGFPASNAADGNQMTHWSANDGNTGHWVKVDLGYVKKITNGTQVLWPNVGSAYQYKVETSIDNTNWTQVVDKTANTSTDQVQNDY